jgi:hypothetical protein
VQLRRNNNYYIVIIIMIFSSSRRVVSDPGESANSLAGLLNATHR